jgi:hypothetical protein
MSKEFAKIRGFSRVQIVKKGGKIVGDSGWCGPNQVTLDGFYYLGRGIFLSALGTFAVSIGLGTGGVPASNATALAGELSNTAGATLRVMRNISYIDSKTHRLYGTINPLAIGAGSNISNIGIFFEAVTNSLFAGNTYASSALASNQSCYYTYDIQMG